MTTQQSNSHNYFSFKQVAIGFFVGENYIVCDNIIYAFWPCLLFCIYLLWHGTCFGVLLMERLSDSSLLKQPSVLWSGSVFSTRNPKNVFSVKFSLTTILYSPISREYTRFVVLSAWRRSKEYKIGLPSCSQGSLVVQLIQHWLKDSPVYDQVDWIEKLALYHSFCLHRC